MLAECVEQAGPRLQVDHTLGSVDAKRDVRASRPTLNLRGGESAAVDARLGRH
jgi:hypothetical protein